MTTRLLRPQAYLSDGRSCFHPGEQGMEKPIKERLEHWRSHREES